MKLKYRESWLISCIYIAMFYIFLPSDTDHFLLSHTNYFLSSTHLQVFWLFFVRTQLIYAQIWDEQKFSLKKNIKIDFKPNRRAFIYFVHHVGSGILTYGETTKKSWFLIPKTPKYWFWTTEQIYLKKKFNLNSFFELKNESCL